MASLEEIREAFAGTWDVEEKPVKKVKLKSATIEQVHEEFDTASERILGEAEEILAEKEFATSYGALVHKNYVRGLQSKAVAKKNGNELIILDFLAYAGEHEEYDCIEIEGIPNIYQKIFGGVHGDLGTSAMVANLIPIVTKARSGLLTMKDLPVPSNTEKIWKE